MASFTQSDSGDPLVSICMGVYNAQQFLDLSIQSLLAQDYTNFELIISDNGSEDRTGEMCREYAAKDQRIRYMRNAKNINPLENSARMLNKASGDYHMWSADHDIYHVQFISKLISQFNGADESVVLCYPDTCRIDLNENPLFVIIEDLDTRGMLAPDRFKKVMWGLTYCTPIYGLYRTSAMRETWKVRTVTSPDRIYLPELSLKGTFARVPETLFYMRQNRPAENYRVMKKRQIKWFVTNEFEAIIPTVIRDYELINIVRNSNLKPKDKKDLIEDVLRWHNADPQKLSHQEIVEFISHGLSELQSKEIKTDEKKRSAEQYLALIDTCAIFRKELEDNLNALRQLCNDIISDGDRKQEFEKNSMPAHIGNFDNMPSEAETFITPEIFNDDFYYEIRRLSSSEGVEHILEIGSSTGQGSTSAFVQGIHRGGEKANLYCMEINSSRFEQLERRYENEGGVYCYKTSSVPLTRFPKERDVAEFYHSTPTTLKQYPIERVLGWLRQDRAHLENHDVAGNGIQMIKKRHDIKNFDLVLIDGSEFTGIAEMDDVYGAAVIMLDDINSYKNYDNYHRLKLDPAYQLEKENWNLRNGYAIFRKVAPVQESSTGPEAISKDRASSQTTQVVIDGVIFQHQAGRPHGIARVWQNLINAWCLQDGPIQITLLQRGGFAVPIEKVALQIIPEYQWGDSTCMDRDDEMLRQVCQELGADIFVSTYFTRAPGVRNIAMVYDMIPELMQMDLSQPEWVSKNRAIETADGLICISRATQAELIKHYPHLCKRPIQVAHLGIQEDFRRPAIEEINNFQNNMGTHRPYVLLVGNRRGYKNGVGFLNALKQIAAFDLPDVLCVGGEAPLTHEEKTLQDEMRVRYVGHLSDANLVAAYGGAEALIVPSLHEGFGLPVIEAMKCGCPVIAQRSAAIAEIGGKAVLFADLTSGPAIRNALEMVRNKAHRQERVEKGVQHAAQFDWIETAQSIGQFLVAQTAKPSPRISAIVSTCNAVEYIYGCLEDLENQTIANQMEIIVVDSGSEQDESGIVKEFQTRYDNIKYLRTQRETVYQAWNRGIKFALGEFISNANTDDRHRKDAFEHMTGVLQDNEKAALVYADVLKTRIANETFETSVPSGVFRWPDWNRQRLLCDGCFIGPQPVWRKKVHATYGYFDESYHVSSDFEFWLRISQTFDFYHLGEPLGLYLDRPDSVEHANFEIKRDEDAQIYSIYQAAAVKKKIIGSALAGKIKWNEKMLIPPQIVQSGLDPKHTSRSETAAIKQGEYTMSLSDTILNAVQYMVNGGHPEAARWSIDKLEIEYPDDANIQFQAGQMAQHAGDWSKTKTHFKAAAQLAPQHAAYKKCLGDYYYVVEKEAHKALAQYLHVLELEPNHMEALTLCGHINTSLHQYDDAKRYYQRVLEMDTTNSEIREIMEKIECQSADAELSATPIPSHHETAKAKAIAGDPMGAIESLEQLLQHDGEDAMAHNDLGVHYYGCGKMDDAQHHYENAVTLQPENITFQKNLADFYLVERGDHERALSTYVQVLKRDPLDIESQLSCSQICLALGKEVDARDFIKVVLLIEPWNTDAQQLLDQIDAGESVYSPKPTGTTLYEDAQNKASAGDVAGAILKLQQLVAVSPENAEAHNDLGVLYYETGDKETALTFYEKALKIEPDNHNYCKNLADIYLIDFERAEDAMKLYLFVLENNPKDVESLLGTGLVCASVGKPDDAREFYHRALEIDPSNRAAQGALSRLDNFSDGADGEAVAPAMNQAFLN